MVFSSASQLRRNSSHEWLLSGEPYALRGACTVRRAEAKLSPEQRQALRREKRRAPSQARESLPAEDVAHSLDACPECGAHDLVPISEKVNEEFEFVPAHRRECATHRCARTEDFPFAGNEDAGRNLATLQTIVATCNANRVNPEAYIKDILIRVQNTPSSEIDSLLPQNWKEAV